MTPVTQNRTMRMVTAATDCAPGARTVGSTGIARTAKNMRMDRTMKATFFILKPGRKDYLTPGVLGAEREVPGREIRDESGALSLLR